MIKSNKDFVPQLAKEFGITEQEVSNILEVYFKDGKAKAENMVDTDIYFYGLGTLSAKRKKIYDLIKYYKVRKERVGQNTKTIQEIKDRIINECEFKINQLNLLLEKYKEQDIKRKNLKLEQENITRSIQE